MTRYHARWICPVSSPPIENGTLVVHEGRIAFVGKRSNAPADPQDVDLGDAILIPGLVNTHCHLELTAMRGFLEGLDFRTWILRLTAARRAVMTPDMMLDAARLGVEEGIRSGVTTFADTGDSGAGFDAMLEYGVRGICYREVFGPDPSQCGGSIAELEAKVEEMVSRKTALVRVGVSPHAPYSVSDDLFAATAELARRRDLPVAVHIAESQIESDLVVRGEGQFADGLRKRDIAVAPRARSPIALLRRLRVLDRRPLLIHCIRVDEQDISDIVAHDCSVAHCPASNAKLAHGIAPLVALLDAGVRVGIGTDSVASNDSMSLLGEARLAALMATARELRPNVVTAAQALELATLGGARALGLDGEVGSLEAGKAADFAVFPMPAHRAPVHEPVGALIYSMSDVPPSHVMIAGVMQLDGGVLRRVASGVSERVCRIAAQLHAWHQRSS